MGHAVVDGGDPVARLSIATFGQGGDTVQEQEPSAATPRTERGLSL
jgi:hypothetical protein